MKSDLKMVQKILKRYQVTRIEYDVKVDKIKRIDVVISDFKK